MTPIKCSEKGNESKKKGVAINQEYHQT